VSAESIARFYRNADAHYLVKRRLLQWLRQNQCLKRLTMDELTMSDILLLLESLEYSRMNITHGTTPYEVKQPKLKHLEAVMAKLRALRDDMRRNP
jgi:hypothetical protein